MEDARQIMNPKKLKEYMQLNKLLSPVEISEIIGCGDKEITGVTADSRQVRDGYMFVAVPGVSVDGHAYIHKIGRAHV